jgi:hypothetical protein
MSKKSKSDTPDVVDKISRDDIEARFKQLTGDVNDTAQKMSKVVIAGGAAALVLMLIMVFLTGRSKGQKKTTVIEIVRV